MSNPTQKPIHILVAVDGSEQALAGVQMVKDLYTSAAAQITLMSVFPARNAASLKIYEQNLNEAKALFTDQSQIVHEELVAGIAAESLCVYAAEHQVDLIVMGAVGMRSAMGILLGGVAQQVVEYAERPVMVMRAPYRKPAHVLLVTDGSPCSSAALNYMARFPLAKGTQVDLMHVLPPPPISHPMMMAYAWPVSYPTSEAVQTQEQVEIAEMLKEEHAEGEKLLAGSIEQLASLRPDLNLKSVLWRGDAATEILDYTRTNDIDLIVTGSRGLSQVRGWLLGSVSRKLLHYAPTSVLVVRSFPGCLVDLAEAESGA